MRIGIAGIGTFLFLLFLIFINYSEVGPQKIDTIFEELDANVFDKMDQNVNDANLGQFIKYTAKGIGNELHGSYYLASWFNTFLPSWVIENLELLLVLTILSFIAPVIFYGALTLIVVFMIIYEKVSEWRKRKEVT